MSRRITFAAGLLVLAACAVQTIETEEEAIAAEERAFTTHERDCFEPVEVTAALVRDAGEFGFGHFTGAGALPPFVRGSLSPLRDAPEAATVHGAVVFLRGDDGAWSAVLPRPGEGAAGIYGAAHSGALIFATMIQTEGPGPSWTLMRSRDGLSSADCVVVDFPDTLNKPAWANEFLDLVDLDIGADGRGEIIGVARTENRGELWYVYETRDGGATWSRPRRIRGAREARGGLYEQIPFASPPQDLLQDLERFAAGR